jgi:hypothetical protein
MYPARRVRSGLGRNPGADFFEWVDYHGPENNDWPHRCRVKGRDERGVLLCYIFLGFIEVIFIALFMCIEQPAISCCDIDDLAAVISCMAIVLFSPSGIFIIVPSAFAMLASEQPAVFAFAKAGTAPIAKIATAVAQANLYIMFVPQNSTRLNCRHEERLFRIGVPSDRVDLTIVHGSKSGERAKAACGSLAIGRLMRRQARIGVP